MEKRKRGNGARGRRESGKGQRKIARKGAIKSSVIHTVSEIINVYIHN